MKFFDVDAGDFQFFEAGFGVAGARLLIPMLPVSDDLGGVLQPTAAGGRWQSRKFAMPGNTSQPRSRRPDASVSRSAAVSR